MRKPELKDGLYPKLPRASYDAIRGRANWSRAKVLGKSPAHYKHELYSDGERTDALRLGGCAHTATLEPDLFSRTVAIWEGDRRGNAWKAFAEANAHLDILKAGEAAWCKAVAAAVRAHPDASRYLAKGTAELTVLSTLDGVACKSRLDWLSSSVPAIVDLKSTLDASPEGFAKEVWKYRYDAQGAWYQDAYEAVTGQVLPIILIAVEKTAPHVVQVFHLPDAVLDVGRYHYRGLLERLRACQEADVWPGYAQGVVDLVLPRWADAGNDDDISGLDLEFAQAEGA